MRPVALASLALAAWLGAAALFAALDRARPPAGRGHGARYVHLARQARPAFLGYDALVADVIWLQAVQLIAERQMRRQDLSGLYPYLDAATELDRKYRAVYYLGGTALVALDRRPEEAVRLLQRGANALPDDWQIPFLLGYTYLFYYQDHATAAGHIEAAARKVGRDTYLTRLAARLHAQAGSPDSAIALLDAMRRRATDPAVRAGLEQRLKEAIVDRDLQAIEAAAARYREAHGRPPETVQVLVRAALLPAVPQEPFGGLYVVDPATGGASTTSGYGRLTIYRPPGT